MSAYTFARLYDSQYADFIDDLAFWEYAAEIARGTVLELGCGSGRVLLPLAGMGFSITGLDHDADMLNLLTAAIPSRSLSRITLLKADIHAFDAGGPFGLVIIPCNLFSYLDDAAAGKILKNIEAHLDSNGFLAMDMPNASIILDGEDLSNEILDTFEDRRSGTLVQVSADQVISSDQSRVNVEWHYDVLHANGNVERVDAQRTYHLRTADQMRRALEKAGLELVEIYGTYQRSPYHPASPRQLILARTTR